MNVHSDLPDVVRRVCECEWVRERKRKSERPFVMPRHWFTIIHFVVVVVAAHSAIWIKRNGRFYACVGASQMPNNAWAL